MDWPALEKHFVRSTKQNRPAVDNAIEWDYSRYSRALGMTALPGLHQLPASSVALVTGGCDAWNRVHDRYVEWAGQRGYRMVRVSAYPSLQVPDPVVAGIANEIAGPDSLILARSGQQGDPAIGKRPRSPGCSLPISPGERWLIAADRVRRRLRQEIALQGIVVQIDDAEKLTGNSLEIISYFVRAHTAWKDRMLSRDARIYFVLATTPRHEDLLLKTLRRFGICDLIIDRAPQEDPTPKLARLSVEDEHLLALLDSSPVAIPRQTFSEMAGETSVARVDSLVTSGVLRVRADRSRSILPPRGLLRGMPAPARAVAAMHDRVRRCVIHSSRHLWWVLAVPDINAQRFGRSLARVRLLPRGMHCLVPLSVAERFRDCRGASCLGDRFALAVLLAAVKQDEDARSRVVEVDPVCQTKRGFIRFIELAVSAGRDVLDRLIPSRWWPALRCDAFEDGVVELAAVLLEYFHRMRWLSEQEQKDRFAAVRGLRRSRLLVGGSEGRLRELLFALELRMTLSVASPAECVHATQRLAEIVSSGYQPVEFAYLRSTIAFAETQASLVPQKLPLRGMLWTEARALVAATGNVADQNPQSRWLHYHLACSGRRLDSLDVADEAVLTAGSPESGSHSLLCRGLSGALPRRAHHFWELPLNRGSGTQSVRKAVRVSGDAVNKAWSRMTTGRGHSAVAELRKSGTNPNERVCVRALSSTIRILGSFRRLERVAPLEVESGGVYGRFLESFSSGLVSVVEGDFQAAQARFLDAVRCFPGIGGGQVRMMRSLARVGFAASGIIDRWMRSAETDAAQLFVELASSAQVDTVTVLSDGPGLASVARYWMSAMERALEAGAVDLRSSFGALLLLKHGWRGGDGVSFGAAAARCAPLYAERIVRAFGGDEGSVGESLDTVLVSLGEIWGQQGLLRRLWSRGVMCLRAYQLGLSRGQLGTAERGLISTKWHEDAAVFRHVRQLPVGQSKFATALFVSSWTTPFLHECRVTKTVVGRRERWRVETEWIESGRPAAPGSAGDRLRGRSTAMDEVRALIRSAAKSEHPVLIFGETGVGKSLVAKEVHRRSSRLGVVVTDCSTLTHSLVESELFGHSRGAFTGAERDHLGILGDADGKTWILDGIEELPLSVQAMLLRAIEIGEFRPVGATARRRVGFRLISVARGAPRDLIAEGRLREDLYYRISTLEIAVPPLRERKEDLRAMVETFEGESGCSVSSEAIEALKTSSWPGNVRELFNCLWRAHARAGRSIERSHLDLTGSSTSAGEDARAQAILAAAKRAPCSARDVAASLGISKRSALRDLQRLIQRGQIRRLGAGRSSVYVKAD